MYEFGTLISHIVVIFFFFSNARATNHNANIIMSAAYGTCTYMQRIDLNSNSLISRSIAWHFTWYFQHPRPSFIRIFEFHSAAQFVHTSTYICFCFFFFSSATWVYCCALFCSFYQLENMYVTACYLCRTKWFSFSGCLRVRKVSTCDSQRKCNANNLLKASPKNA